MKKLVALLLALLAITVSTSGLAAIVKVTNLGGARVRSGPDVNSSYVGKAEYNHEYEYIETASNGWLKIRLADGTEGYISGKMGAVLNGSISSSSKTPSSSSNSSSSSSTKKDGRDHTIVMVYLRDHKTKVYIEEWMDQFDIRFTMAVDKLYKLNRNGKRGTYEYNNAYNECMECMKIFDELNSDTSLTYDEVRWLGDLYTYVINKLAY